MIAWAGPRPWTLMGLTVLVATVHLLLAEQLADAVRLGTGAADRPMHRIEVAFVRELQPTAPPPPPPVPAARPKARPRAVPKPAPAASAPVEPTEAVELAASAPVAAASAAVAAAPEPPAVAAEAASEAPAAPAAEPAVAAASAPAVAASAAGFDLPPSTRLSYHLTGDYRGPVEGKARVEWLRSGSRYQVHLDVSIGPVLSRRMSSEGEITDAGLKPSRYEEETRVMLKESRRVQIAFEPDRTMLAGGREAPALPGLQDAASQFVQLAWTFNTHPERLKAGEVITVPLALPRKVENWLYDVVGEERLVTPMGEIPAVYLKPRREFRKGSDLVIEMWFAPILQYLPVRIRIRQDAETYADLMLERLPQQSEAAR
jgi:hypothetical protein